MPQKSSTVKPPEPTTLRRSPRFLQPKTPPKPTSRSGSGSGSGSGFGHGSRSTSSRAHEKSTFGSRKTSRLTPCLEGIEGVRRSTRCCKELISLGDDSIQCNRMNKRRLTQHNVVGKNNRAVLDLGVSPVTPKLGGVSGGTKRRVTRSCFKQMGLKVRVENTEKNEQRVQCREQYELRVNCEKNGKQEECGPLVGNLKRRDNTWCTAKHKGKFDLEISPVTLNFGCVSVGVNRRITRSCSRLVGLKGSVENSLKDEQRVQCRGRYELRVNCEENGKEECGQVVVNSKRINTRRGSKHKGKTDLGGQKVEGRNLPSSPRFVGGKVECARTKEWKLKNSCSLKCVLSTPQKRITRSSAATRLEEEAGISGQKNDNGEFNIVSCDALGGVERETRNDMCKKPELIGAKRKRGQKRFQGLDQRWTREQEIALQRAYFSAKPSPHFWKKVAKVVPGKSAQECFDKVHSDNLTPHSIRPSKTKQLNSPIFSLSSSELFESSKKRGRRIERSM